MNTRFRRALDIGAERISADADLAVFIHGKELSMPTFKNEVAQANQVAIVGFRPW